MDEAQEVKGKVFKDLHFELIRRAAAEIHDHGTFDYAEEQVLDSELCRFFCRSAGSSKWITGAP